ncbi:MAG: HD domain-containing protein [Nitrospirae bacterium]|nr:HD domain-containing protein [Nitrospirota bacterium]
MSDGRHTLERERTGLGLELVRQLSVLMRLARTHGAADGAWGPALEKVRAVATLADGAALRLGGNALYLGDERLRPERDLAAAEGLIAAFRSHGVGAVSVRPGYRDEVLTDLLCAWGGARPDRPEEGFAVLADIAGQDHCLLLDPARAEAAAPHLAEAAKALYARALHAVAEVMDGVGTGQAPPLRRAKRVVHRLVDALWADPAQLLGLTTLRCHAAYTGHHAVNVCVLALALGRRLGLSRPMLAQLGMAALLHDIGKGGVPPAVLDKAAEFTQDEWALIRRHPVDGVKAVLRLKGADASFSRLASGAFEHHMNLDHSGYPRLPHGRDLSLFGRVIALADCYDAMTSARVYNRTPVSPERALRFLLNKAGSAFDPVLTKVFVNAVGIFPVGTLLQLTSGELAVVTGTHRDPFVADRPPVRLLTTTDGTPLGHPAHAALDERGPDGAHVRHIARVVDARAAGIDVSRYFL